MKFDSCNLSVKVEALKSVKILSYSNNLIVSLILFREFRLTYFTNELDLHIICCTHLVYMSIKSPI